MGVRIGGLALACLIGFPVSQAVAQSVYSYPPRIAPYSYDDEVPPGYYERALRRYDRRVAPRDLDDDDDVVVIQRRGPYVGYENYPDHRTARRYYRVVPGPYDDPPPAAPYFRGRDDTSIAPDDGRWRERQAALPPVTPQAPGQSVAPQPGEEGKSAAQLDPRLRRQIVHYQGKEPAGTIIVDTRNTYLYYTLGNGQAMRYGIGVGREGFTWAGREKVSRMAEWPDWYPPQDMIQRQPYLPRMMAGGPGNPLGARALYLGNTLYRIHGTSDPSSIGKYVSSGCIRLLNEDITDLYSRVHVGTRVVVLSGGRRPATASTHH